MIVERIKELAKKRSTNITEIERSIGLGKSTIIKWNDSNPTADKLLKVANHLNVTVDYLLTGEKLHLIRQSYCINETNINDFFSKLSTKHKEKIIERIETLLELQDETESDIYIKEKPTKIYSVREKTKNYQYETVLLGLISAGKGIDAIENKEVIKAPVKCDFALQVKGDSMEPKYHNEQILYFKQTSSVDQGQIAAVQIEDDFIPIAYLKKIYFNGPTVKLVSINPDYQDIICPLSSVRVLGRVIEF